VDAKAQQAALEVWRREHNEVRPHEALGGRRPAELYRRSPRALPKDRPELGYGPGYLARSVTPAGTISYQGHQLFISSALAGWHVGLRPQGENAVEVWFSHLLVGTINLQTMRFGSAPSRSAKAHGLAA
jgi:hypothetical protein